MSVQGLDDTRQWYWAAKARSLGGEWQGNAGARFVVAQGEENLWWRVRQEVDPDERCAWMGFGSGDTGKPTLADCLTVLLTGREVYGADLNKVTLELAQVPAFAKFVRDSPSWVSFAISNPISHNPLPREPYSREAEAALGRAVGRTLKLADRWWE